MKALTITQPWASLIAIGAKQIETRSWSTTYRGPIAIHAGRSAPVDDDELRAVLERHAGCTIEIAKLPRGVIVAVADLVRIESTETLRSAKFLSPEEDGLGDYSPDRYGWMLENVVPLRKPIEACGLLRLWTLPPDVLAQLDAQVPAA